MTRRALALALIATIVRAVLHIVLGKGGVGKSTVAAAVALSAAKRGAQVLAIELSPPAGLARLLGVSPIAPGQAVEAHPGVWLSFFDGEAALAEYLLQTFGLRRLLNRVFAHPVYRAFASAAPGLKELMAIGKVRDEVRKRRLGGPLWDTVVVDAGASGHALQYLRMPQAAAGAFGGGLVRGQSVAIDTMLRDPDRTALHVVALPEEMPLAEAEEVIEVLRHELNMPVARLVINRCREIAPPGTRDLIAGLNDLGAADLDHKQVRQALHDAAVDALVWLDIQERGIAETERHVKMQATRLPLLQPEPFGLEQLGQLAMALEGN